MTVDHSSCLRVGVEKPFMRLPAGVRPTIFGSLIMPVS